MYLQRLNNQIENINTFTEEVLDFFIKFCIVSGLTTCTMQNIFEMGFCQRKSFLKFLQL